MKPSSFALRQGSVAAAWGGPTRPDRRSQPAFTLIELLVVIAILALPSGHSLGQTYGDFGYTVSGSNVTIASYTGSGGAVSIPSLIPGVGTVTAIGDQAFYENGNLTSVTIPGTVTSIGSQAFVRCTA